MSISVRSSSIVEARIQEAQKWQPNPALGHAGSLCEEILNWLISLTRCYVNVGEITSASPQISQQSERLFLWCHGFAAASGGLDDILSRSPEELRACVWTALYELGRYLQKLAPWMAIRNNPPAQSSIRRLEVLLEKAEIVLNLADMDKPKVADDTDMDEPMANNDIDEEEAATIITMYIDCLMDCSPALQSTIEAFERVEHISPQHQETFEVSTPQASIYCRKIRDRFPTMAKWLVERLGEANARRFIVMENGIGNYSRNKEESEQTPGTPIDIELSETLFSDSKKQITDGTRSTVWSKPDSIFDTQNTKAPASVASSKSFFTTASGKKGLLKLPSIPKKYTQNGQIICYICSQHLPGDTTRSSWKKHVFSDLSPYLCTFNGCKTGSRLYQSSSEWAQHERVHLVESWTPSRCHFCNISLSGKTIRQYYNHISKHLQEISLVVLPPPPHDTTDDDDSCNSIGTSDTRKRSLSIGSAQLAQSLRAKIDEVIDRYAGLDPKETFINEVWPALRDDYEVMRSVLVQYCKDATESIGIRCQISSRTKTDNSIQKSLVWREEALKQRKFNTLREVHQEIHDLVRLRIVVEFPDDLFKAVAFVKETFIEEYSPAFFTSNREVGGLWATLFGAYRTHNYWVSFMEGKSNSRFSGVIFEIQITALAEDIYNKLAHDISYKQASGPFTEQDYIQLDLSHGLFLCYGLCLRYMKDRLIRAQSGSETTTASITTTDHASKAPATGGIQVTIMADATRFLKGLARGISPEAAATPEAPPQECNSFSKLKDWLSKRLDAMNCPPALRSRVEWEDKLCKFICPDPSCSRSSSTTSSPPFFSSQSDLDAHTKKRHTLPFICVFHFAGCASTFASKNEWKRHVTTQHLLLTYWLCTEGACANLPAGKSEIFDRKDLYTEHLKRMHCPTHIKKSLLSGSTSNTKNSDSEEWEEMLRAMQARGVRERCKLPEKMECPVAGCKVGPFEGRDAWDMWMEHVARHLEGKDSSSSTSTTTKVVLWDKVDFGERDKTLIMWASDESIRIIVRRSSGDGWELKKPLDRQGGGGGVANENNNTVGGGGVVIFGGGKA